MRRTLFTILVAAMFAACGDGSDPELGNGLETETGEESDGLTDETSEEDGEGSDADDGDDTTGEHDTETESTSDSDTGSETEPAGNPGPGDRCDPLLAFDGTAPCETPEGDIYPYTCALVQQNGFGPLKPRCVRLADPQGDGNEWHDKCEAPDIVGDSYTCLNTVCVRTTPTRSTRRSGSGCSLPDSAMASEPTSSHAAARCTATQRLRGSRAGAG